MRFTAFVALSILAASFGPAFAIPGDLGTEERNAESIKAIKIQAALADNTGRYPDRDRSLKSGYKNVDNEIKATWAYDLGTFIKNQGEKVSQLPANYIPYRKRAEFADLWWLRHSKAYKGLFAPWDKDGWQHDAIVDGTELYWLGVDQNQGAGDNAITGHDSEMAWLAEKRDSSKK